MLILNYFLFVCFINLCNSFNKQIIPNFISRYCRNKLNMGCDYYIDKNLHIYDYDDREISYINVEHEKGYYFFVSILDEDEDGYEAELEKYIKDKLTPYMKSIVIYSNNAFNKISFENKYKKPIEDELKIVNKIWDDVNKIIKIESRYER